MVVCRNSAGSHIQWEMPPPVTHSSLEERILEWSFGAEVPQLVCSGCRRFVFRDDICHVLQEKQIMSGRVVGRS